MRKTLITALLLCAASGAHLPQGHAMLCAAQAVVVAGERREALQPAVEQQNPFARVWQTASLDAPDASLAMAVRALLGRAPAVARPRAVEGAATRRAA